MYCEWTADILDENDCRAATHVFIYTQTPSAADSLRPRDGTQWLTRSNLNLPMLSYLSTTRCELLSQFSPCTVVHEDDLQWVTNEKNIFVIYYLIIKHFKTVPWKCSFYNPRCRKSSLSSKIQDYTLMHREGFEGSMKSTLGAWTSLFCWVNI